MEIARNGMILNMVGKEGNIGIFPRKPLSAEDLNLALKLRKTIVKIQKAETDVRQKNQARLEIIKELRNLQAKRHSLNSQLKLLIRSYKRIREIIKEKKKDVQTQQHDHGKLRRLPTVNLKKGFESCSTEQELNDTICSLGRRMQHGSKSLAEERRLVREVKKIEGTREEVIAKEQKAAKDIHDKKMNYLYYHRGRFEVTSDLMALTLDKIKSRKRAINTEIKYLDERIEDIDYRMRSLRQELVTLNFSKSDAYEVLLELRKQYDKEVSKKRRLERLVLVLVVFIRKRI